MKYTSKSLKYVFANFGYLVLFGLFPAVFLAYSLDTATVGAILRDYFTGSPYASFSDIFHAVSIFNFHSVSATIADVLSVILAVTCVAMMMAFMEKHMRIGKKTWTGLFSKLNDNLLSTLGITLLFACLYELWALITSALLLCVSFFGSKTVIYILSVIVWFGTQTALLFVVSLFYLWLPCLQITGFRSFEALSYSYQLATGVKRTIVREQFVSMTIAEILIGLVCVFAPWAWLKLVLNSVVFAGQILLFVTRMQVVYFDRAQLERADEKNYYFG